MRSRRSSSTCRTRSSGSHADDVAVRERTPRTRRRAGRRRACRPAPGRTSRRGASVAMPQAAASPPVGVEDLHRLREAGDAREQRDLLAAQAARLPAAVPVLVEAADRVRGLDRQADQERDLGAAVAARLHQRARHLALVPDRLEPAAAVAQRPVGGDRPQRPQERRQLAGPVDALGGALRDPVVGGEQRRHAGGVGRAAGVLEQQRVEEVGAGPGVEADLLGEPHADQARAQRMAGRLALGEVERIGERTDDLRQPDRGRVSRHDADASEAPRSPEFRYGERT